MFCLSLNMQIFSLKENKFLINTDFESELKSVSCYMYTCLSKLCAIMVIFSSSIVFQKTASHLETYLSQMIV